MNAAIPRMHPRQAAKMALQRPQAAPQAPPPTQTDPQPPPSPRQAVLNHYTEWVGEPPQACDLDTIELYIWGGIPKELATEENLQWLKDQAVDRPQEQQKKIA
jgi:hypothetical protein